MKKHIFQRALFVALAALMHLNAYAQQDLEFRADPFYNNDMYVNSTRLPVLITLQNVSSANDFDDDVDIYFREFRDSNGREPIAKGERIEIKRGETYSKLFYANIDRLSYVGRRVVIEVWVEDADSGKPVSDYRPQSIEITLDETEESEANFFDFDLPAVGRFGDKLPINVKMKIDGADYIDERALEVYAMVQGKPASQKTIYRDSTPVQGNLQQTVEIDTVIDIDGQHFSKGGGNVVIIWPIGFIKAPAADSSTSDTMEIDWPLLIDGDVALDVIDVYPSISQGNITVTSKDLQIERVRIFSANGKSYNLPYNGQQMQVEYMEAGVYTLEVALENGTVVRRQVVFVQP